MRSAAMVDEKEAALTDYYQQQVESALEAYALIGSMLDDSVLSEPMRARALERQRTAAVLVAATLLEWQQCGGVIKLSPAILLLLSAFTSREATEMIVLETISQTKVTPVQDEAPKSTPAPAARRVERGSSDRHVIVVEGTRWKPACRARLARLRTGEIAAFIEAVKDEAFLDSLPTEVCHTFLEYAVSFAQRLSQKNLRLDIICEVSRYIECHRLMQFLYGVAAAHAKESRDADWALRMEQTLEALDEHLSEVPPKMFNRDRRFNDLKNLLAVPETKPKEIIDLVEQLLFLGVEASNTRLVNLLLAHREILASRRSLRAVKKAVIKRIKEEQDDELAAESKIGVVPNDWPWFAHTNGRNAVIYGGTPVPGYAEWIRETFGFASVEWKDAEHRGRAFGPIEQSIKNGSCDFVILLVRFTSHRAEDLLNAAKRKGVSGVRVHHGYGLLQIKLSIEETLPNPTSPAALSP